MSAILDIATAPVLSRADLETLVRVPELVKRALFHGWIKPTVKTGEGGAGKDLYSRRTADALVARILAGEVPPAIPREKGAVL